MKVWLAFALMATGCAAPSAQPDLLARTVDGVTLFERRAEDPGRLVVQDAIEWRGTFAVEASCLVLTIDGQTYTPIFGNPASPREALADARPGSAGPGARSWSIQGSRAPAKDEAGYSKAMGGCSKRPFLVSALSDPRPAPGPR